MASKQHLLHVLLLTFPTQGHVNPVLRLGKLLASKGNILVTLCTCNTIEKKLKNAGAPVTGDPVPVGNSGGMVRFNFFDDGCPEDNDDERNDFINYIPKLKAYGTKALTEIINHHAQSGWPVSCLISNPALPWVCDVAQEFNIPCALL